MRDITADFSVGLGECGRPVLGEVLGEELRQCLLFANTLTACCRRAIGDVEAESTNVFAGELHSLERIAVPRPAQQVAPVELNSSPKKPARKSSVTTLIRSGPGVSAGPPSWCIDTILDDQLGRKFRQRLLFADTFTARCRRTIGVEAEYEVFVSELHCLERIAVPTEQVALEEASEEVERDNLDQIRSSETF